MADKAIAKWKKEIDERYSKQHAWDEGLVAGVEEMMKRIVAKDPNSKQVAMETAMDIFNEMTEMNRKLGDHMRQELSKCEERIRAEEFAGAGKK